MSGHKTTMENFLNTNDPGFTGFPMRQIHLDFHTSPDIPDVGADWDPDHFAQTLTRARVNSVTLFATCHHGMSY